MVVNWKAVTEHPPTIGLKGLVWAGFDVGTEGTVPHKEFFHASQSWVGPVLIQMCRRTGASP